MKVKVEFNFFLSVVLVLLMNSFEYTLIFLASAALHEFGHLFFLKIFKIKKAEFTLGLIGAQIRADMSRLSYVREALVYLGGALFNLAASVVCPFLLRYCFDMRIMFFFFSNVCLALVNLFPVASLDGGRALECFLLLFLDPWQSTKVLRAVSVAATALLTFLALSVAFSGGNITLLLFSSTLVFYLISGKPSCRSAS